MKIEGINLKYLKTWYDAKRDRTRFAIRRKGQPLVELKVNSDPRTPEFLEAYFAALRCEPMRAAAADLMQQGGFGSVRDGVARYLASEAFEGYSKSTQDLRRPIYNRLLEANGKEPLAKWNAAFTTDWLAQAKNDSVRSTLLLALKPFAAWLVEQKLIKIDPTEGIKITRHETEGHHSWEDSELEQYKARYPLGTVERVAIELALNVCGRKGDIVRLGRQHLRTVDGELCLVFTQEKNAKRKPITVTVPVLPELQAAIEACPVQSTGPFLLTERGQAFSKGNMDRWWRRSVQEAGLPERCVMHGLRKAAARILAEHGCTDLEIMAVGGWTTLKEVQRYTKGVNRAKMAARAMRKRMASSQ